MKERTERHQAGGGGRVALAESALCRGSVRHSSTRQSYVIAGRSGHSQSLPVLAPGMCADCEISLVLLILYGASLSQPPMFYART